MTRSSKGMKVVGEFLLIVVGVLTALAAESWAERQRERATGSAYLEQLRLDTEMNQTLLEAAIQQQDEGVQSIAAVRAARRGGIVLSTDSMAVLIGRQHLLQPASVQLVMGTVSALVSTADLNVIADSRVRLSLLNYAGRMEQLQTELELVRQPLNDYGADIVVAWQADTDFKGDDAEALGAWITSRNDPRTLEALAHLWLDGANMLATLRSMGAATDTLAMALAKAEK